MIPAAIVILHGERFGCRYLSLAQNRPGRGAFAVRQHQRQTGQLVLAGPHPRQIQALDDPDPRTAERLMRLDAVFPEPAVREVVDADGSDLAVREVAGCLLRDVYEVLDEILVAPCPRRISRLEEDTLVA